MFQPEKRFPMATEYAVEVPAGTKAMNGQALAQARAVDVHDAARHARSARGRRRARSRASRCSSSSSISRSSRRQILGEHRARERTRRRPDPPRRGRRDRGERQRPSHVAGRREGPLGRVPSRRQAPDRDAASACGIKAGAPSAEGPRRTTKDQSFSFSHVRPDARRAPRAAAYGDRVRAAPAVLRDVLQLDRHEDVRQEARHASCPRSPA